MPLEVSVDVGVVLRVRKLLDKFDSKECKGIFLDYSFTSRA